MSPPLNDARVLIVDDERVFCEIARKHLERGGYSCTIATRPEEARALLERESFDLVLCDVHMPRESGVSLAGHIAARHADTAVMMVSANDDPAVATAALRMGAYGYMVKPIEPNEFLIGAVNALTRLALEQQGRANRVEVERALTECSAALEHERTLRQQLEVHARENASLLASLQERQVLLERLSKIQRSISHRAGLQEILDAVVDGAHTLLGEDIAALRLVDQNDRSATLIAASRGISDAELDSARRAPTGSGADGRAIERDSLVVVDQVDTELEGDQPLAGIRASAAMSAPVHEAGRLIGSLVIASRATRRPYTIAEREMLLAFAEHASLALTDARTLEQMNDALHDSLTRLPNRNLLTQRVEQAIGETAPDAGGPAVLLIDLDGFGKVNDSIGHDGGDMALVQVAERLRACVGAADTVARFGGDDFAILLTGDAERENPEATAERVFEALRAPLDVAGKEIAVAASIGIACGSGSAHELLRHADIAMYRCKRSRDSRYERFTPGMKMGLVQHLALEADLQRAVERGEFEIHYQPIVAIHGQLLAGFEGLVRWRDPKRGLVPPLAFIPLAEEMGLINAIGRVVLREACEEAVSWDAEHPTDPPLSVSVNVSARQLKRPDFADEVAGILHHSGLDPARLVLEIDETVLMRDAEITGDTLLELKKLGIRLAIDNFGSGYSSLSYLRRFPLDVLKIAKPFIDGVARATEDSTLVRTIVELATGFQLDVVAQGVETLRQRLELARIGCTYAQGYHYAKPLDRNSIALALARASRGYGQLGDTPAHDFALPPLRAQREPAPH